MGLAPTGGVSFKAVSLNESAPPVELGCSTSLPHPRDRLQTKWNGKRNEGTVR